MHFWEVVRSFREYGAWASHEADRRERHVSELPAKYSARLPGGFAEATAGLRRAIALNQTLLGAVASLQVHGGFGAAFAPEPAWASARYPPASRAAHFSKVRSTLHQFAREWSAEGADERAATYGVMLGVLRDAMPPPPPPLSVDSAAAPKRPRVLVPGCGLGRLVFDAAMAGYSTVGVEFSYQMLFASQFILGGGPPRAESGQPWRLVPWADEPSNHMNRADALREVVIPDVSPLALLDEPGAGDMSMAAGDFVSVFDAPDEYGAWDAVLTAFFIDCAPNPLEFIDVIHHVLRPGGIWINLGPLHYHWVAEVAGYGGGGGGGDSRYERSIELTAEELLEAVRSSGFDVVREGRTVPVTYAADSRSLMCTVFNPFMFTAIRR